MSHKVHLLWSMGLDWTHAGTDLRCCSIMQHEMQARTPKAELCSWLRVEMTNLVELVHQVLGS